MAVVDTQMAEDGGEYLAPEYALYAEMDNTDNVLSCAVFEEGLAGQALYDAIKCHPDGITLRLNVGDPRSSTDAVAAGFQGAMTLLDRRLGPELFRNVYLSFLWRDDKSKPSLNRGLFLTLTTKDDA